MDQNIIAIVVTNVDDVSRYNNMRIHELHRKIKSKKVITSDDNEIELEINAENKKIKVNVDKYLYIVSVGDITVFIDKESPQREITSNLGTSDKELRKDIIKLLLEIGVSISKVGFKYLADAIIIAVNDEDALKNVRKSIYKVIGDTYNTSWQSVEQAIRRAFCAIDKDSKKKVLEEIFRPIDDVNLSPADVIRLISVKAKKHL